MNVVIDGERYIPAPVPCEKPELLDFVFHSNDLNRDLSIREYLHELLKTLWDEGEGFSGKRPFGNSCWEFDLYCALIKAGAVDGRISEEGYLDEIPRAERDKANTIVFSLIAKLCGMPS
ncbi:TPA: hypothetical protein QDB28_004036 [Burkholderia vietnamiensis]|nr:hypothetical protein [Burkholderia vietnamiensis]